MQAKNIVLTKEILNNGIRYFSADTKNNLDIVEFFLIIKVGSINDPPTAKGMAHYLEHMLLSFSDNQIKYINDIGNIYGYTDFEETVFHISCLNKKHVIDKTISLLKMIITGQILDEAAMTKVTNDIIQEWHFQVRYDKWKNQQYKLFEKFKEEHPNLNGLEIELKEECFRERNILFPYIKNEFKAEEDFPVGKLDDICHITYEQIKVFHHMYYTYDKISCVVIDNLTNSYAMNGVKKMLEGINKKNIDMLQLQKRNFKSCDKSYMLSITSEQVKSQISVYFFVNQPNNVAYKSLKEKLIQKIILLILSKKLKIYLLKNTYKVKNMFIENTRIMKNGSLHIINIEFNEKQNVECILKCLKNLLEDLHLKKLTIYEIRQLKKRLFIDFYEHYKEIIINDCIEDFIYGVNIENQIDYYKLINSTVKELNLNRCIKSIIRDSNISIHIL